MIDTKLIILEGLPGTGKTTNSFFLLSQLECNGIAARWVHENARPHPTSYFNEACLSYEELELTKEQWSIYEEKLLSFLELKNLQNPEIKCSYNGTYRNEEIDIEIKIEEGYLINGRRNRRKLIPKSYCDFYIHNLPVRIKFINQDNFQIEGEQINERWTTVGLIYHKM